MSDDASPPPHGRAAGQGRRRGVAGSVTDAEALARVAPLEGLDARKSDLDRAPLLAVVALVLAHAELTLGEDLVALAEPLGGALGGLVPELHPEPLGLLDPLAVRARAIGR